MITLRIDLVSKTYTVLKKNIFANSNESKTIFSSNSKKDLVQALDKIGIKPKDTNFCLSQMEEEGHNVAEFGVFNTYITSSFEGILN